MTEQPLPGGAAPPARNVPVAGACIALVFAVVLCAVVAWQLLVPGPFDFAVADASGWQGGLEAAALLAGLALLQHLDSPRRRLLASLLLAALYARRHAIDAPFVLCLLYLEFTLAFGAAVLRAVGATAAQRSDDYLRAFVVGLAAWSVLAWTCSALGWGTPTALRALTLLLLPIALWARNRPLTTHLWQRSQAWARRERVLFALLAGWVLILFARANVAFSFDGLWYGLRPEYVLTADGSVFAPLGLVSPVHYFPKLFEVWLLPLSALGDPGLLGGMSVLLLGLLALTAAQLLMRLGTGAVDARLALVLLVTTLPAIANAATEPKPDIACALFVLLALLFAGDAARARDPGALAWAIAAGLLALSSKLIAVPYLGLLGVALALAWWRAMPSATATLPVPRRAAFTALALAAVAAAFVVSRTWLLAGVPTIGPDPLYKIWTLLGLSLREPAGTLDWAQAQDWADVPALVVDWLLRPDRLEHIMISWTGNVWLWLPLAALLLRHSIQPAAIATRTPRWLAFSLIATGAIIALGWRYHTRGSDGNYFIAALVPALAIGIAFAWRQLHDAAAARRVLFAGIALFAAFQAAYAFVSASWTPGTRPLDLVFDRSPRDADKIEQAVLAKHDLSTIGEYLRAQPGIARVVGCAPFAAGVRLPARFEDFPAIALSRPDYTRSLDSAIAYMRQFSIRYLLLPKPRTGMGEAQIIDGCTARTTPPAGTRLVLANERFLLVELADPDSS